MKAEEADTIDMIKSGLDDEMEKMAQDELRSNREKLEEIEHKIKIALLPKDEADEKNVILEIRAGTGGDEAALFAAALLECINDIQRKKRLELRDCITF